MTSLDTATVEAAIARGIEWRRDGEELVKTWSGADFSAALAYVNAVGELAEQANHHPDIDIRWATVTLRLSTHSAGGITQADLDLASQIDQLGGGSYYRRDKSACSVGADRVWRMVASLRARPPTEALAEALELRSVLSARLAPPAPVQGAKAPPAGQVAPAPSQPVAR